ncbi:MAG: hypothetical protein WAT79_01585 [Saprospiraceae bacterium]
MNKIVLIIIFGWLVTPAQAQEGLHFGGGLTYNTDSLMRGMGIQAKLSGSISEKFILHGAGTYYFKKGTYYAIDADLHYQFINSNERFFINPFAGINLTRTFKTNTSLNLGISFIVMRDDFHYYIEPKFIVDDSQFVISIGIMI